MIRLLGTVEFPSKRPRARDEGEGMDEKEKERLHWTTLTPELLLTNELTRPRRFTRRAPSVRDAYALASLAPSVPTGRAINDDDQRRHGTGGWRAGPRSISLVPEKGEEREGNRKARARERYGVEAAGKIARPKRVSCHGDFPLT